jgi:hypothetical protein
VVALEFTEALAAFVARSVAENEKTPKQVAFAHPLLGERAGVRASLPLALTARMISPLTRNAGGTPAIMCRSDALYSCTVARRLSRGVEVIVT